MRLINRDVTFLREGQDIAKELQTMLRLYNEQYSVVREFAQHLEHHSGEPRQDSNESALLETLINALKQSQSTGAAQRNQRSSLNRPIRRDASNPMEGTWTSRSRKSEDDFYEAEALLQRIRSRQLELEDLEESALRICQQVCLGQRFEKSTSSLTRPLIQCA